MECLRLRGEDIDFFREEILVRDDKEAKDRITMLPEGGSRVSFIATIYPSVPNVEIELTDCNNRIYVDFRFGILYGDLAVFRCYEETIYT